MSELYKRVPESWSERREIWCVREDGSEFVLVTFASDPEGFCAPGAHFEASRSASGGWVVSPLFPTVGAMLRDERLTAEEIETLCDAVRRKVASTMGAHVRPSSGTIMTIEKMRENDTSAEKRAEMEAASADVSVELTYVCEHERGFRCSRLQMFLSRSRAGEVLYESFESSDQCRAESRAMPLCVDDYRDVTKD